MESKTKYRILGILVIIALVVIVMPFIHFKKDSSSDIASAPSFPDQNTQVTSILPPAMDPANEKPADTIANANVSNIDNTGTVVNAPSAVIHSSEELTAPVENQTTVGQNVVSDDETTHETTMALSEELTSKPSKQHHLMKKSQPKAHVAKANVHKQTHLAQQQHSIKNIKLNSLKQDALSIRDNGLYDIKTPVWVIQLGSFQSKSSAVRLVNSLRASGYKAFFQEIETVLGEKTRVFVGPELDQVAARHLAKQLEAELKVRGVVASYKPFNL